MEKSGKRGKIPQTDWPLIMARYEKGETLASIARTYDCSPPAISYIVSRSKARQPVAESELLPAEPQLIKAHPESTLTHNGNGAAAGHPAENGVALPLPAPAVGLERRSNDAGANRNGLAPGGNGLAPYGIGLAPGGNGSAPGPNGFDANASTHNASTHNASTHNASTHNASTHNASTHADRAGPAAQPPRPMMARPAAAPQPPAPANAEQRRTLHLSLGGNGTNGQPAPAGPPVAVAAPAPPPAAERPDLRPPLPPRDPPPARYGYSPYGERAETRDADPGRRKEGGNFIDQELRARVDGDIAAFLAAFDAALADDTVDSRSALREATDRLLRAGARTRIELERLEARVPLAAHGDSARAEPHWRHHR